MPLSVDLANSIRRVLGSALSVHEGDAVPDKRDQKFLSAGGAVRLDAAYVCANLVDASVLTEQVRPEVAAKIIQAYVHTAATVLRAFEAEVWSFHGDRVMAIFAGADKHVSAVRAAFALNWSVEQVINPVMFETWDDLGRDWRINHAVGVAAGSALIVRGGVFGTNDLIAVGSAPNVAGTLGELRQPSWHFGPPYSIYITEDVYTALPDYLVATEALPPLSGQAGQRGASRLVGMWDDLGAFSIGGVDVSVRGSLYEWEP